MKFGMLLLILCWNGLFSVFANFRGEISLFLISKVFSLLDAVIIFSKSSGDIYQNLLEIRAPLIYLTLSWYSNFIHPCKAKKQKFPDFSTHKVATGTNYMRLETFTMSHEFSNVSLSCLRKQIHSHTCCNCRICLQCEFLSVSSTCLRVKMHNHIGYTCEFSLQSEFSNVSSNRQP